MSEIFETENVDLAEHVLSTTYTSMRIQVQGQRQGFRLDRTALGPVMLDQIRFGMSFDAESDPLGALAIAELISGQTRCESDSIERFHRHGDVYLTVQPEHPLTATLEDAEVQVAVIDPALLSQVADGECGRTQQPVRFTGYAPVSPDAAQTWKTTYAYARDTVRAMPGPAGQPLVTASAVRLLVATALAVFPNNAFTDPTIEDRHDAHPDTLRRAVTFIDEHAHRDITVADIAAAACVTIRAIQLAFRRHMDTTPLEYLRRVRLDHAHRDLIAADPAHETVTAVAYRWGFSSPSRFAAHYRAAYGLLPGDTLRQR